MVFLHGPETGPSVAPQRVKGYHGFLVNFLKYILVFSVVAFYNILSASQYQRVLVGIVNKIALARVPSAC